MSGGRHNHKFSRIVRSASISHAELAKPTPDKSKQFEGSIRFDQKGKMMRFIRLAGLLGLLTFIGCTSMGSLGLITKSSSDPVALLGKSHTVKDLGPAQGRACRYFALAVVPWGNSDIQTAVDRALKPTAGNALVNISTSTSLYGFVPVYNVFSFTCTTVKGTAVKIE